MNELAEDLMHPALAALAAMGDRLAVVTDDRVIWATPAWRALWGDPPQRSTSRAELETRLPGLRALLAKARGKAASCEVTLRDAGSDADTDVCLLLDAWSGDATDAHAYTLRLREPPAAPPARSLARATKRHLEDRERLLFTSRSVAVGEMASTLAHEINQPIGAVTNVLRGIQARLDKALSGGAQPALDLAHLQQGVRLALDQALFAARVIGRIREYTHSRQPRRDPVDPHALLRDSVRLLDWEFERDGVSTTLALADEGAPVWTQADAVMLQQVVINLLRNALDALRERSHGAPAIRVSTVLRAASGGAAGDIEITIRDNGCGLADDAEQRLFVPFQSTKPTGMGIGLNICRSFIELHQGRLWFSRNPPQEGGCAFHVALPLVAAAPPDAA
jgi:two-component system, LuxR family, sensor kinase FixL